MVSLAFNEVRRTKLCLILGTLNWICFFASLFLIASGAYIRISLNEYINLILNYNDNIVPFSLIGLGIISLVFCCFGGALYFFNHDPANRQLLVPMLYVYMLLDTALAISLMADGIICYQHVDHLEEAFHGGLADAMLDYKIDQTTKVDIDLLQMEYECCGNKNFTDWFKIDWIHEEYRDVYPYGLPEDFQEERNNNSLHQNYTFIHDNAPFSCCNPRALRPCINIDILDYKKYVHYNYKNLTIHAEGCLDKLMDYFGDDVLANIGAVVFAVFGLKFVMLLLTRVLQTSILTALANGDLLGPSTGYIVRWQDFGKGNREDNMETTASTFQEDPAYDNQLDRTQPDKPTAPTYMNIKELNDAYRTTTKKPASDDMGSHLYMNYSVDGTVR